MNSEKLQKVLARHGLGARREIERWIEGGRLKVNGVTASLGIRVGANDRIELDGKSLAINIGETFVTRVLIYNKPVGEVSTRKDEQNRPTVFDTLPKVRQGRWVMVGRLDVNTSGLLIFTNDGEFAARLMHPSYELEREYAVRLIGEVAPAIIDRLKEGVSLEDGVGKFEAIEPAGGEGLNRWYRVILKEGRYREVRRLWESQHITVNRLIRLRYGAIILPRDLRMGRHRELEWEQVKTLAETVHYPLPTPALSPGEPKVRRKTKYTPPARTKR